MIPVPGARPYRPSPYNSTLLHLADRLSARLCYPGRVLLDTLISLFIPTSPEQTHLLWFCMKSLISFYIVLPVFLSLLFPAMMGLALYALICEERKYYRLSSVPTVSKVPLVKDSYTFGTINMCGHYEWVNRLNNFANSRKRLTEIGNRIVQSQLKYMNSPTANETKTSKSSTNGTSQTWFADRKSKKTVSKYNSEDNKIDVDIKTEFAETDIFLLQEAMKEDHGSILADILHKVYPYAVYDATEPGIRKNGLGGGSGLMVVSKYPILKVCFNRFKDTCGSDLMACKGVLQVKVDLGQNEGQKYVGYVTTTHMQVYPGEGLPVHVNQLTDIVRSTKEFRDESLSSDEHVLFDVVGGDFNLDNTSEVDKACRDHPIWDVYYDACREAPGRNKPGVVGSEFRSVNVHDHCGSTPTLLKSSLEDPKLRRWLIMDSALASGASGVSGGISAAWSAPPRDKLGEIIVSDSGGMRKVDFLMPRKKDNVIVRSCCGVTQLAGQTDHLPYSLTIQIPKLVNVTKTHASSRIDESDC